MMAGAFKSAARIGARSSPTVVAGKKTAAQAWADRKSRMTFRYVAVRNPAMPVATNIGDHRHEPGSEARRPFAVESAQPEKTVIAERRANLGEALVGGRGFVLVAPDDVADERRVLVEEFSPRLPGCG